MKIAILSNGYSYHYRFYQMEEFRPLYDDVLNIRRLEEYDLLQYDTLIIPERMSLQLLKRYQSLFLKMLNAGKKLIVFGEVIDGWLPGVDWENSPVNFSWWVKENGDLPLSLDNMTHSLFRYIGMRDVKWHYHGTFGVPQGAFSLVNTPEGRSILYIDDVSYEGTLLVTSLDPMFHLGLGFIDQGKSFMYGFMAWLRKEGTEEGFAR
ncbi:hypothetical protein ACFPVX_08070 [Cohnella faecalis]|uniref:Uncharacterized protein n=1 Tax=Cohnella faecalis TaxID=2315694 RepID=A0A398CS43_9BACL|nr:hypothetical protein [Cohnella faecalis]RIE04049.1 hypothetical protein D3H35_08850 [Cohnella faecalis]